MENVKAGIPGLAVYCNDIIIYFVTPEQHLQRLNALFAALVKFGIKLEPEKCKIMHRQINWFRLQMTPEKDKLEKMRKLQPPTTVKEIRMAIGLFQFFRLFVKIFSKYSLVLSALIRKSSTWKGGLLPENALQAFNHLKTSLLECIT